MPAKVKNSTGSLPAVAKKKATSTARRPSQRVIVEKDVYSKTPWVVHFGTLKPSTKIGRPSKADKTERLFRVIGEKLPYEALNHVKNHLRDNGFSSQGVYVAHDSMGCPRYIGRGNIFARLAARKKAKRLELEYFSFYVVEEKMHEREIETLLIRAAGFLLEFNDKKKRVGIAPGGVNDYEPGTLFYVRRYERGARS
jgi:hypothetical protein